MPFVAVEILFSSPLNTKSRLFVDAVVIPCDAATAFVRAAFANSSAVVLRSSPCIPFWGNIFSIYSLLSVDCAKAALVTLREYQFSPSLISLTKLVESSRPSIKF